MSDMSDKILNDAVEMAAREGRAPEQEDFMTAAVLNQCSMSPEERRLLQADLRAIELGTSTESFGSYTEDFEDLLCEYCGCYPCQCREDLSDEESDDWGEGEEDKLPLSKEELHAAWEIAEDWKTRIEKFLLDFRASAWNPFEYGYCEATSFQNGWFDIFDVGFSWDLHHGDLTVRVGGNPLQVSVEFPYKVSIETEGDFESSLKKQLEEVTKR